MSLYIIEGLQSIGIVLLAYIVLKPSTANKNKPKKQRAKEKKKRKKKVFLTNEQKTKIIELSKIESQSDIAKMFNVSQTTISKIIKPSKEIKGK